MLANKLKVIRISVDSRLISPIISYSFLNTSTSAKVCIHFFINIKKSHTKKAKILVKSHLFTFFHHFNRNRASAQRKNTYTRRLWKSVCSCACVFVFHISCHKSFRFFCCCLFFSLLWSKKMNTWIIFFWVKSCNNWYAKLYHHHRHSHNRVCASSLM